MSKILYFCLMMLGINNLLYTQSGIEYSSNQKISFSVVGDLMCHSTQFNWAEVKKDSFDFKPVFGEVKGLLSGTDFTVGNLETVIDGNSKKYTGYPVFNSPPHFLEALSNTGFDILATANNHSTDGRKKGIINTINAIKNYGMDYSGSFLDQSDRDSLKIYSRNGLKFVVLSYSYGLNNYNLANKDKFMLNLIDTNQIKSDFKLARENSVDIIIVYLHIGQENQRRPSDYQKEIVSKLIEYGVDVVLASSSHVLQPIDFIESRNSKVDSVLIAYNLGNFISNQRWRYSDCGVILNFNITKNFVSGKMKVEDIEYTPVWVFKGLTGQKNEYKILPSDTSYAYSRFPYLQKNDKKLMSQSYDDTKTIINLYSDKAKIKSLFD